MRCRERNDNAGIAHDKCLTAQIVAAFMRKHGIIHLICLMSFGILMLSPYLPRAPAMGDAAGRLWQGCHNSAIPLLVRLAHTTGLPLKSVGEREQVSLSAALSLRPICRIGSRVCVGRSEACPVWTASSWRRTLRRYHAVFVPVTPCIQLSR